MISSIDVRVRGLPEEVQHIADALDLAFPGRFHWHVSRMQETDQDICLVGSTQACNRVRRQEPRRRSYKANLRPTDQAALALRGKLLPQPRATPRRHPDESSAF